MLFAEEDLVERHVGIGEYRGLEFLHVNAKRIINRVPANSRMPFRYTINAYRGCSHACAYCVSGETLVLLANGRTRSIRDLAIGDAIVGTEREGRYLRYVTTTVVDHWASIRRAFRVVLDDGTELVASGDHRFLSNRGWKHVTGAEFGPEQRPFLTPNDWLLGPGALSLTPYHDADYKLGYVTGVIRGDRTIGTHTGANGETANAFRLALVDLEALQRARLFLETAEVETNEFQFAVGNGRQRPAMAIRTGRRANVQRIRQLIEWPTSPTPSWRKGFLAGIYDAEGSYSTGMLRISISSPSILGWLVESLHWFDFDFRVETANGVNCRAGNIRLNGGLSNHLRFFQTVDPAITRKRTFEGGAVKSKARRRVISVTDLGVEIPMFDITTGTGDFVANGVISHNCFARPTHEYLGLNTGKDFETKLVVKVNAVDKVRAELRSPKWQGDVIAMGTNTDPYQRAEGKYHLTRGIVAALADAANPFSILTKSPLILRDLDQLVRASKSTDVHCALSIGTLDEEVWKATEPGAAHPRKRVDAVRRLAEAGIATSVLVAPIIPGWSDRPEQLEAVTDACLHAGAQSVTPVALHLRPGVKEHFLGALEETDPERAERLRALYPGAYLSRQRQSVITDLVRDAARRHPSNGPTPPNRPEPPPTPDAA